MKETVSKTLIARAQAGDGAAREELLQKVQRPLYDYFILRTRDGEASRDLLQNTMLKLLTHLPQLRQAEAFNGWMYAIARSQWLDLWKKRREISAELDPERYPFAVTPLHELLQSEEARQLAEAIDRLPPRQREVVLLRVRQDLSFREIAELLAIREENARVTFHQALKKLQAQWSASQEESWNNTGATATTPW